MAVDYIDTIWRTFGSDQTLRTMAQMGNGADTVENRLSKVHSVVGNAFTGAGAAGAALFASSLKKGMDAIETDNLVNVTFGDDSMPDITKWSKDLRKDLSLNEYSLRRNAASFANLFQQTGAGQGEVIGMSKNVTELSRDLASFYNTSNDDAVRALQGALVGLRFTIVNCLCIFAAIARPAKWLDIINCIVSSTRNRHNMVNCQRCYFSAAQTTIFVKAAKSLPFVRGKAALC